MPTQIQRRPSEPTSLRSGDDPRAAMRALQLQQQQQHHHQQQQQMHKEALRSALGSILSSKRPPAGFNSRSSSGTASPAFSFTPHSSSGAHTPISTPPVSAPAASSANTGYYPLNHGPNSSEHLHLPHPHYGHHGPSRLGRSTSSHPEDEASAHHGTDSNPTSPNSANTNQSFLSPLSPHAQSSASTTTTHSPASSAHPSPRLSSQGQHVPHHQHSLSHPLPSSHNHHHHHHHNHHPYLLPLPLDNDLEPLPPPIELPSNRQYSLNSNSHEDMSFSSPPPSSRHPDPISPSSADAHTHIQIKIQPPQSPPVATPVSNRRPAIAPLQAVNVPGAGLGGGLRTESAPAVPGVGGFGKENGSVQAPVQGYPGDGGVDADGRTASQQQRERAKFLQTLKGKSAWDALIHGSFS